MRRFAFRLALELGQPNPDAMLAEMPSRVFFDWMRHYRDEPFGEQRADLRMGIMTANILTAISSLAAARAGKRRGQTFKPADFMPYLDDRQRRPRIMSPDTQFKKIWLLNKLFGGTVIDKRKQPN